ncbi:MAG: T9SS type A sorting domain-containing protein [Bacteroidetes bacterium]|nr:T9SS type A sorting domain-containing protein [Bacteroidota bacterium]
MKLKLLVVAVILMISVALRAQNSSRADLSIFPNPAAEFFSVDDHSDLLNEISIISLAGRKVKIFTYNKGEQYSISDLPKGMYLVQMSDKNKRILTTQKLEKR